MSRIVTSARKQKNEVFDYLCMKFVCVISFLSTILCMSSVAIEKEFLKICLEIFLRVKLNA